MTIGTGLVSIIAYPLFKSHFYGNEASYLKQIYINLYGLLQDVGHSGLFYPLYIAKSIFTGDLIQRYKNVSFSHVLSFLESFCV